MRPIFSTSLIHPAVEQLSDPSCLVQTLMFYIESPYSFSGYHFPPSGIVLVGEVGQLAAGLSSGVLSTSTLVLRRHLRGRRIDHQH